VGRRVLLLLAGFAILAVVGTVAGVYAWIGSLVDTRSFELRCADGVAREVYIGRTKVGTTPLTLDEATMIGFAEEELLPARWPPQHNSAGTSDGGTFRDEYYVRTPTADDAGGEFYLYLLEARDGVERRFAWRIRIVGRDGVELRRMSHGSRMLSRWGALDTTTTISFF
jgi:hypothetical protein